MKIETLSTTPEAEKVVCKAARNDYMDEWIGDISFREAMDDVDGESIREKKYTLLKHLIRSDHFGPLEHVHASFMVKGISRVTMAQVTRHRLLSFDIQSQRYVDFSDPDFTTPPSFTNRDHFSRDEGEVSLDDQERIKAEYESEIDYSVEAYNNLVEEGIPKEDARYLLPNAIEVNMVLSGNLRALLHVVNMRSKADVQHETRELAEGISAEIEEWVPTIYEIMNDRMPMRLGL